MFLMICTSFSAYLMYTMRLKTSNIHHDFDQFAVRVIMRTAGWNGDETSV
jgi:hypothetical protein